MRSLPISLIFLLSIAIPLKAQIVPPSQVPQPIIPRVPPTPQVPSPLPSQPENPILNSPTPKPQTPEIPAGNQETIRVEQFVFKGNTIFSNKQLEAVVAPFVGRTITFAQLLQARTAITELYTKAGYITSGAFIPIAENQNIRLKAGVVTIQIIEGKVEAINISGRPQLHSYVRSRLRVATSPVFNYNRLLERLRLLQVNPLIKTISAEVTPGSMLGQTVLNVRVVGNPTIAIQPGLNNERSPLVGTFERRITFTDANLLGLGDRLSLTYRNTEGSNAGQASYTLPLNPHDTTLQFNYTIINSTIIEPPFDQLDITEDDRVYELTLRQPLLRSASERSTKEFAIGLTALREEGNETLLGIPFPISPGADDKGRTRISALRFFQEWNQRSNREVLLLRSQFSLGVEAFDAIINENAPDSRFFVWRGQAAWLRRLNRQNLLLLTRADLQFASTPLVPFEQFSLGGVSTVRGYRQNAVLTDSGVLGSVELRIPVISSRSSQLTLALFVDVGYGFNVRESNPAPNTLISIGLGLEYSLNNQLRARLDYGIPIIDFPGSKRTLQENGLYLSIFYNFEF